MSDLPRRKTSDVIREYLPLAGARVIDVGCGDGSTVRFLARQGARVTGVECGEAPLARARKAESVADENYLFGYGQALPVPDGDADIVTFFNSLHHVPVDRQSTALREAARALKTGGVLFIQEPVAAGPSFEMMRPLDDETQVRDRAIQAINDAAASFVFESVAEHSYMTSSVYRDFDEFCDHVVLVDTQRASVLEQEKELLQRNFEELGEHCDRGRSFDQPMRLNLLRRT